MIGEAKWELVQNDRDRHTRRLQVPGGWLYLVTEKGDYGGVLTQNMTFVPKPVSAPKAPKA